MPEVAKRGQARLAVDSPVEAGRPSGLRTLAKWGLGVAVTLLVLWFPTTWFFFGSVHPCGVLANRMRPRHVMIANLEVLIESNEALLRGAAPGDVATAHRVKLEDLRQVVYERTPASCLWRSLTWRWDPDHDAYIQRLEARRRETYVEWVEFTARIVDNQRRKARP